MSNRNGHQSFKNNNSYQNKSNRNNRAFYDNHLSEEKVNAGLLAGFFFRGCFKVNPKKRKVGYVSCEGLTIDICIDDDKLRNRAIQGDIVAIELLPKSEWLSIKQRLNLTETVDLSIDDVNDKFAANWSGSFEKEEAQKEEEILIQQELWQPRAELLVSKKGIDVSVIAPVIVHEVDEYCQQSGLQPRGRIVGIITKSHVNLHIGALKAQCDIREGMGFPESETLVYFNPADQRFPNLIIHRMQLPEAYIKDPFTQQKQIYLAEISESWPDSSRLPIGCNIRSVGEMGSIQAETEALLIANDLNHGFYTEEQLKPLNEMLALSQENKSVNNLTSGIYIYINIYI
jgi:exoribonuclease R